MKNYFPTLQLRYAGLTLVVVLLACRISSAQNAKASFEKLIATNSTSEMIELWKGRPFETLPTIDSYLEGSLKLVETSNAPDQNAIHEMHAKAMQGATAADKAFGSVIFSEYASSFIGWNREQQKQFRLGQKAHADARTLLQAKQFEEALTAGQDCLAKAQPLGDWWGTAMGYAVIGAAHKGLGASEKALTAYTLSRSIYHDLRLGRAELQCTVEMVSLLKQAGNTTRAKVTCLQGIALAEQLGDNPTKSKLTEILAGLK